MIRFHTHVDGAIANDYRVIPIVDGAKEPGWLDGVGVIQRLDGWSRFCERAPNESELRNWKVVARGGIGVCCGNVVGIDIDILDHADAEGFADEVVAIAGAAPYRIGNAPKRLYIYRAEGEIQPRSMKWNGGLSGLDILGVGRQFVAYGMHPNTGREYVWFDGNPLDTPVEELPAIDAAKVEEIIKLAVKRGAREARVAGPKTETAAPRCAPGTEAAVDWILRNLPNDANTTWDEWTRIAIASFNAGATFDQFRDWSAKSPKHDEDMTAARWRTAASNDGSLGFGSLVNAVAHAGLTVPPDINFHEQDWSNVDLGLLYKSAVDRHNRPSWVIENDVAQLVDTHHLLAHYHLNEGLKFADARNAIVKHHDRHVPLTISFTDAAGPDALAAVQAAEVELGRRQRIDTPEAVAERLDAQRRFMLYVAHQVVGEEEDNLVDCDGLAIRMTPQSLPRPPGALRGDVPGGLIRSFYEWCLRTAPRRVPEFAVCGGLALTATLIGRAVKAPNGARPNLYVITIAPSSSGKNHALDCVTKALGPHFAEHTLGSMLHSGSGVRNAFERAAGTLTKKKEGSKQDFTKRHDDGEVDGGDGTSMSKLFMSDEIGMFFGANAVRGDDGRGSDLMGTLMSIFSQSNGVWAGATRANEPPTIIPYPHLNVLGASTSEAIFSNLTVSELKRGYANRFLLVECEDGPARSDDEMMEFFCGKADRIVPDDLKLRVEAIAKWVSMEVQKEPGNHFHDWAQTVEIDTDAAAYLVKIARLMEECAARTRADKAGELVYEPFGRLAENTLRVALNSAVSRMVERIEMAGKIPMPADRRPRIRLFDVCWAFDIVRYSAERMAHVLHAEVPRSKEDVLSRKLETMIDAAGPEGIAARGLCRKFGINKAQLASVIDTVKQSDRVFEFVVRIAGRSARRFISVKHWSEAARLGIVNIEEQEDQVRELFRGFRREVDGVEEG